MSSTAEHETLVGRPEAVSLDTTELVDLGDGRTRSEVRSVVSSVDELMATGAGA